MLKALPQPSQNALKISQKLSTIIKQKIVQEKSIAFSDFMTLALYHPELGYYCNSLPTLGAQGDFITAPEISPLFSHSIANQCAQIINNLSSACIVEYGAGLGSMAKDILLRLEELNNLPEHYYIVEISPSLKSAQQAQLQTSVPHLLDRISWVEEIPHHFVGIVLGNEFIDAFPVDLFALDETAAYEKRVGLLDGNFTWDYVQPSTNDTAILLQQIKTSLPLEVLTLGYESEINLGCAKWLTELSQSMQQGVVLLIDYGFPAHEYYHPDRRQGTLMCHYKHHLHADPFWMPGLQDLTTHVDFTALATTATQENFQVAGFTNQANFLLNSGIMDLIGNLAKDFNQTQLLQQSQQLQKLLMPSEMGELCKVIALTRDFEQGLAGFSRGDQRHRL